MGTKAKLSTKVLSIFLSVLMAASCLSVALPSLAPKAFAASAEQTAWQDLADAFVAAYNGGYMSTKDWAGITVSEGSVEVTDGTANGYAYNIVVALGELLKLIGADKHNSELRTQIFNTLRDDYSVTLNGYQTNFLNKLLDVSGMYGTYGPDHIWNGSNADMAANLTEKTITVSVTREESAAIMSDFDRLKVLFSESS